MTFDATRYVARDGVLLGRIELIDATQYPYGDERRENPERREYYPRAEIMFDDTACTELLALLGYTVIGGWEAARNNADEPVAAGTVAEFGEIAVATVDGPPSTDDIAIAATVRAMVAGEDMGAWIAYIARSADRLYREKFTVDGIRDYEIYDGSWKAETFKKFVDQDW